MKLATLAVGCTVGVFTHVALDAYAKESEAKPAQLDWFENGAGLNVAGRAAPSDGLMFASMGCGDSYCGALNHTITMGPSFSSLLISRGERGGG